MLLCSLFNHITRKFTVMVTRLILFPVASGSTGSKTLIYYYLCIWICSAGDSSAFVASPTSVFPPSTAFAAPASQSASPHESGFNQEANGKCRNLSPKHLMSHFKVLMEILWVTMSFYFTVMKFSSET